jgi:hypothetical protein
MNRIVFFIIVSFSLVFLSCSKNESETAQISSFEGRWTGRFTGNEDNGTWTATISALGVVTGTANSNVFPGVSGLVGTVNKQGDFTATVGSSSDGARFSGKLIGNSGSGTWINSSAEMSGGWSGTKQ